MNHNMFPPSKKPRLDISYGASSQVPAPTGPEPPGSGTQAMDLGDDWDDDNLFIEAADEFDKLIALSQVVPTTNVNIIQPTGKQNSEVKPFPTKLSTVHFPDSPKSSKVPYNSGGGSASKFQKSKSFNFDQIATNLENRSDAFRNNNVLSTNGTNTMPESSIKQSELYKTKCGENEILQKQIKNLTTNLHESKCKLRQAMHDKDRERNAMKQEMEQKMQDLRGELDRLSTELMFQKNHITSTEFRTRELKHARLKEPESPNSPNIGPGAWKRADSLNSSFSRANTSPRRLKSPGECLRSPGRLSGVDQGGVRADPEVEVECHYGCALYGIVGEQLLKFTRTPDGSNSPSNDNSVISLFSSDLVQLVTCASFLTSKAKHLIRNILIGCNQMISCELSRLNHLAQSEDKGDITKRDHELSKSCFSIMPAGQTYDLLHSKKLFTSEESSELRRCIYLLAILCSISAFAVSSALSVSLSDLVRDNALVCNLESINPSNSDEIESAGEKMNCLASLKQLVTLIGAQNRTKSYNGVLLSIAHLVLEIFHQKPSLPESTLNLVTGIVKEVIMSRPGPAVLEMCVRILAESAYCPRVQETLCAQSVTPSYCSPDLVHSFSPSSCPLHVLCTFLELLPPSPPPPLIRAYLSWTRTLLLRKPASNSRPCDCRTEVFHGFLTMAWIAVHAFCREFTSEPCPVKKHEIQECVELAYRILYMIKQDKQLLFLQREGVYEALLLRLKSSNLNISLADKTRQGLLSHQEESLTNRKPVDLTNRKPVDSTNGKPALVRSIICGDHLDEEFNDLDI